MTYREFYLNVKSVVAASDTGDEKVQKINDLLAKMVVYEAEVGGETVSTTSSEVAKILLGEMA